LQRKEVIGMEWKELQPYLRKLNGQATIIVNRERIESLRKKMFSTAKSQLQDLVINCAGVKEARFLGVLGYMYRVPAGVRKKYTIGKVPTLWLEGKIIYSEDDTASRATSEINIPIDAITSIQLG